MGGGPFNDLLNGGHGTDHLIGSACDDVMVGEPGADYFDCEDSLDTVVDYSQVREMLYQIIAKL
ncbi:MAG TPA: hypothetical protein VFX18_01320 [Candidatus Nitrosocosmicus sp.]|nr:hypothetical protein [Candidatus Nitrosocosmicus sp.]